MTPASDSACSYQGPLHHYFDNYRGCAVKCDQTKRKAVITQAHYRTMGGSCVRGRLGSRARHQWCTQCREGDACFLLLRAQPSYYHNQAQSSFCSLGKPTVAGRVILIPSELVNLLSTHLSCLSSLSTVFASPTVVHISRCPRIRQTDS